MTFAAVVQALTLFTYVVILTGDKRKREFGWRVLTLFFIFGISTEIGGMGIVVRVNVIH